MVKLVELKLSQSGASCHINADHVCSLEPSTFGPDETVITLLSGKAISAKIPMKDLVALLNQATATPRHRPTPSA